MMPQLLAPLANHLWQSTLFGGGVVILSFLMRSNRAAVRYRLWLAASLKFLVPFSLLTSLGHFIKLPVEPGTASDRVVSTVEAIHQPFSAAIPATISWTTQGNAAPALLSDSQVTSNWTILLPHIFATLWLAGAGLVLLLWLREWWRLRSSLQGATPLELDFPIPCFVAPRAVEPGIVGILRPVLLLPDGLTDRLTTEQIDSIVLHEMCHVRRKDNFAASLHMVVEALFWFHPLVWWIERRLVEERERACDEEVLHRGGEPEAYAEGILKVCKFYKESALVCVSGVAGANLKTRIEDIMKNRISHRLNFSRMAVLMTFAVAALVVPIGLGVVQARQAPAAAGEYAFTTIDVPGSASTVTTGIDISGRMVGYYSDTAGGTHGFSVSNGRFQTIDYPGSRWTAAYAINNQGQIVGAYGSDPGSGRHGFLLGGGNFSTFDVPDSVDTIARGINNRGQIVGDFQQRDGQRRGFLLSGGRYTILTLPEKGNSSATAINDGGQVAGYFGSGTDDKGFIITGESFAKIQVSDSPYSAVLGLNSMGDVVGQLDGPQGPFRGFRRTASGLAVMEFPDTPYAANARAINDLGQIVGEFTDRSGHTHGYQASPSALRAGPPDAEGVRRITDAGDPSRNSGGPARAGNARGNNANVPARGDVATRQPEPEVSDVRPLEATLESLKRASTTLERLVVNGEGRGRGGNGNDRINAQKCVDAIAVAIADVNAAIEYGRKNPGAVKSPRSLTANPIEEENNPLMRPVAEVAINNLRRAKHMLDQAIGGDLGGFRPKLEMDIANAIALIAASYTTKPAATAVEPAGK